VVHVSARARDDAGAIAVIVAMFSVVMFALAAMVVDLGVARETRRESQNAADAAALAGAGELYDDAGGLHVGTAIDVVKAYAASNAGTTDPDWAGCTTTLPAGWTATAAGTSSGTSCIAFDSATQPTTIQVVMPAKRTAAVFGGAIGFDGVDVRALAQASTAQTTKRACALCVSGMLQVDNGDITVSGGGDLAAGGGTVKNNGSILVKDGGAILFQNTPNPGSGSSYSPQPATGAPVDPFAGTAMPTSFGPPASSDSVTCGASGVGFLDPGVYKDITVKKDSCVFKSGLFVITGTLTSLGDKDTALGGLNATLYFACGSRLSPRTCHSPGEDGGALDLNGNGSLDILRWSHPSFSVLYDRWNTSPLDLTGNGIPTILGGSVYVPSASLTISGKGSVTVARQLVVKSIDFNGNNTRLNVGAAGLPTTPGPPEISLIK
jgi:Flp pilus assembly protein TadG